MRWGMTVGGFAVATVVAAAIAGCADRAVPGDTSPVPAAAERDAAVASQPQDAGGALPAVPAVVVTVAGATGPLGADVLPGTQPVAGGRDGGDRLGEAVAHFLESERLYLALVRSLPSGDPGVLRRFAAGPVADRWIGEVERWRRAGWRAEPGPRGIDRTVVVDRQERPDGSVELESCTASDGIVYRPGAQPGTRVVLDALLATVRRRVVLRATDGIWQRVEVEELSWVEGVDGCGEPG